MENIAELPATQVTAGQLADLIISRLATQKEEIHPGSTLGD